MIEKIKSFFTTVEYEILNLLMKAMETDSPTVRRMVSVGYYFMDRVPDRSFIVQGLFWVCLGTTLGLGIGILVG
ncbi:MAG TPA: hypothetical protein VJ965_01005 [Anaerolineales bacterium]|nr:hypothetical protein [Anaerolineales bacterium]